MRRGHGRLNKITPHRRRWDHRLGSASAFARTAPRRCVAPSTTNAIGMARVHIAERRARCDVGGIKTICSTRGRASVPATGEEQKTPRLEITAAQVKRLENEIDRLNAELQPLRSFVLPGGTPGAAALHMARTICRRAERLMVSLAADPNETVSPVALQYVNRLSDLLFVASRYVNDRGRATYSGFPDRTGRQTPR